MLHHAYKWMNGHTVTLPPLAAAPTAICQDARSFQEMRLASESNARHTPPVLLPVNAALRIYYFVTFGVMGLYLPYFPSWIRERGFVGAEMGLLLATLPFFQLLSPAVVGLLADKLALRGRMMTLCGLVTALGMTLFAFSAAALSVIPVLLAATCMLTFACLRSPASGLADVIALEIAPDYGRMRLWGSLGFLSLALIGGALIDPTHAYLLPAAISVLTWLSVAASLLLPQTSKLPPRPALSDAKDLLNQKAYRRLLFTMMLIFAGFSAYDLCATLHLRKLGATGIQTGLFWSIATSAEVVLLIWAARWSERIGPGKLLTFACFVGTFRWIFLSQATDIDLILLMQPLHGVSFGLMWVSAIGALKREVGNKGTATAQGVFASAIALGATVGVTTWGPFFETYGSENLFLAAAVLSGLATLSAARLIRLTTPVRALAG
jgi:MFS transporter, PPP family, 3-phenylpropionic acid transporter